MTVRSFDGRIPRISEGSYVLHPSGLKPFQESSAGEWKGGDQDARVRWNRT